MTEHTAVAPGLAEIAALIGDPARACILSALIDGRALTASELAADAGVAPPTASGHLARLVEGGLLAVERQGRHRYHRLASPLVGRMIEGIMAAVAEASGASADGPDRRRRATPRVPGSLRAARTCYDHLAGRLGVAIADGLLARGHIRLDDDGGEVTAAGQLALQAAGVALHGRGWAPGGRRPFCRPCLDWTERRPHLAGRVGAAICVRCIELGWISLLPGTRAVRVTPEGAHGFRESFGADLDTAHLDAAGLDRA